MSTMKKIYTLLFFLVFHSYFCNSQPPGEDDNDRVEVIKMAYMTRELNLTPQEAQNFWPVYNNYLNEIKKARNQYPDNEVMFEKKVVEIKERYQGNFKKVLGSNSQRVNRVYTTDKQFNDALRTELKNRQQRQQVQQSNQQPQNVQAPRNENKIKNQDNNNNGNRNNVNKNNIRRPNGNNRRQRPPF